MRRIVPPRYAPREPGLAADRGQNVEPPAEKGKTASRGVIGAVLGVGGLFLALAGRACYVGSVTNYSKGVSHISRENDPWFFWLHVLVYAALGIMLIGRGVLELIARPRRRR